MMSQQFRFVRFTFLQLLLSGLLVGCTIQCVEAGDDSSIAELLAKPVIDPKLPLEEIREYTQARILPMPDVESTADWERHARRMRNETLDRVVYRGEAAKWRDYHGPVEWLETIDGGPGYRIRKLRFEALPGLWIPALLYEPTELTGKVPVVMNVNGHDADGKVAKYKQIRCINLAKRGMLALNVEWLGMGQLRGPNYVHYRMNQIDLCGTSGLAPFYLAMVRGLDLLLSHQHADAERVAVAGLSGGGWQTIVISSLDPRVTLANPVAGYSSFRTRTGHPSDLGDSEQTPVDLATTADYAQLTALRAPRPTLLTYNANDNCCFKADHALPPLMEAAGPVFELYGKADHLRAHVNHDPGTHNFELDNRQQLYRMIGDFFYADSSEFDAEEIPSDQEVKSKDELEVELPSNNADFHSLAMNLQTGLPRRSKLPANAKDAEQWASRMRQRLADVVHAKNYDVQAIHSGEQSFDGGTVHFWRLRLGGEWTVPATEFVGDATKSTVILVSEKGRKELATEVSELLKSGQRVIAVDPFYFGESKIEGRDFLLALLVSAVGDRPLGLQASQLTSIARWLKQRDPDAPVTLHSVGPRSSLFALVAAAVEPHAIDGVTLNESFGSLKEIIEQNMSVQHTPELFCFGLLEEFDVLQLGALVTPRPVAFASASDRVRKELAPLAAYYALHDVEHSPVK